MSNRIKPKRPAGAELHRSRRARIEQALTVGDIGRAAALAEAALAQGQVEPMFLNLAAWQREEAGDYAEAHRLLQRALALAPGDVLVLGAIGAVLRKEHRLEEALAVLDRVVAAAPAQAAAWLERGYTLEALRSEAAAKESYQRALALDPNLAPALGKLADIAARKGEAEAGRAYAVRALGIDPLLPSANFAMAALEIEAKDPEAAAARLQALLGSAPKGDDRTRTLTLLGDALDRQDRTAEAFEAWRQAQANFRSVYAPVLAPRPGQPSHRSFIEKIAAQVESAPALANAAPPLPIPGAAATHVFLIGYPLGDDARREYPRQRAGRGGARGAGHARGHRRGAGRERWDDGRSGRA